MEAGREVWQEMPQYMYHDNDFMYPRYTHIAADLKH